MMGGRHNGDILRWVKVCDVWVGIGRGMRPGTGT